MSSKHFKLLAVFVFLSFKVSAQDIEKKFTAWPDEAKPRAWWHWMNGNITRQGITSDLEHMKSAGLGAAYIFNVSDNIPHGPVQVLSDAWFDLMVFAIQEADRLGLQMGMHNCPGWSASGGPWIDPAHAMKKIIYEERCIEGGKKVDIKLDFPTKQEFYRDIKVLAFPTLKGDEKGKGYRFEQWVERTGAVDKTAGMNMPPLKKSDEENIIAKDQVVDISPYMDASGHLKWDAPAGKWTIIRFGYTNLSTKNHPAPPEATGLECDKFDRASIQLHFDAYVGKVIERAKPYVGKAFKSVVIDSYEAKIQTWTDAFPAEFRSRRGYDIYTYLPCLTGRILGTPEETDRFLWDFRRTIADLFTDVYYKTMKELTNSYGMLLSVEPYGNYNTNNIDLGVHCDTPTGEFWAGRDPGHSVKLAASIGHIYDRKYIETESFTALPNEGVWWNSPRTLKAQGDYVYTMGITRFTFHSYPHQPRPEIRPGMTMGPHGTFFSSTNTWWDAGKAWFTYLGRSQAMLQWGNYAADILYYPGEDAPLTVANIFGKVNKDKLHPGNLYDFCNSDVICNRIKIEGGKITLPNGAQYSLLVLPESNTISVGMLTRIKELVHAGMMLLGSKPTRAKGLEGYPQSDEQIGKLADELWGKSAGKSGSKSYGKGKIYWGMPVQTILNEIEVLPDFEAKEGGDLNLNFLHRRLGGQDVYFIANRAEKSGKVKCYFRVNGKIPELWDAVTGRMIQPAIWYREKEMTCVPLDFYSFSSIFVLFRSNDRDADPVQDILVEGKSILDHGSFAYGDVYVDDAGKLHLDAYKEGGYELRKASGARETVQVGKADHVVDVSGSWDVYFDPKMGGPGKVSFDALESWTKNTNDEVKYYSGTAVYTRDVELPASMTGKRIWLEFDSVMDIAQVQVNASECGTLWTPPYRIDISQFAKPGRNRLEISVTNAWNNRLIGDERHPLVSKYVNAGGKWEGTYRVHEIPAWYLQGEPLPASKRVAFSTWRVYDLHSPLIDAGLIGQAKIVATL